MTLERFEALVRRLEEYARRHPRMYRFRVAMLAAVWNAIALVGTVILAGLIAWIVIMAAKGARPGAVLLPALVLLFYMMFFAGSVTLKLPLPVGLGLDRQKYPKIFKSVDEICDRLQAPRVDHILLDDDLNAAMAQYPRLGLLGFYRNYLIIGLPLTLALTPEQFRAVIAHEIGHLSRRHGRFGHWIYRAHGTIQRWMEASDSLGRNTLILLLLPLLKWYVPYFAAYSFVLRRADEYEADQSAAELVGERKMAEALIGVGIASRFMQSRVWPEVYKMAKDTPEPPEGIFPVVTRVMATATRVKDAPCWARQAIMAEPQVHDSHPRLSERLAALGQLAETEGQLSLWRPQPADAKASSAAEEFFSGQMPELVGVLEKGWRVRVAPQWKRHHRGMAHARAVLRTLENRSRNSGLTDADAWRRCVLAAELLGNKQAIPLFRQVQQTRRMAQQVNFALGKILLEEDDGSGIELLESAMKSNLACVFEACDAIASYYARHDRPREAEAYLRRSEVHFHALRSGSRERQDVAGQDEFRPHDLTYDLVDYLCTRIEEVREIAEAWLVEKVVKNFASRKMYVLGIVPKAHSRAASKRIEEQIRYKARSFKKPLMVVILGKGKQDITRAIRAVEGARIYPRESLATVISRATAAARGS